MTGVVLVVLGLFWTGRESSHGIHALWEHWWCILPVVALVLGVVGVLLTRSRITPPVSGAET